MTSVSIQEAQTHLAELIDKLGPGEEVQILRDDRPVAKLIAESLEPRRRQFGLGRGKLTIVADDDQHLDEFKDYMP